MHRIQRPVSAHGILCEHGAHAGKMRTELRAATEQGRQLCWQAAPYHALRLATAQASAAPAPSTLPLLTAMFAAWHLTCADVLLLGKDACHCVCATSWLACARSTALQQMCHRYLHICLGFGWHPHAGGPSGPPPASVAGTSGSHCCILSSEPRHAGLGSVRRLPTGAGTQRPGCRQLCPGLSRQSIVWVSWRPLLSRWSTPPLPSSASSLPAACL